jgi:hypothetical protein
MTRGTCGTVLTQVGVALSLLIAPAAHAATCTLQGTAVLEPMDNYYCDNTWQASCSGWKAVDYASTSKPLRYMRIRLFDASSATVPVAQSFTGANGAFSFTWNSSAACAGQLVRLDFVTARADENHLGASPQPYRFKIVDPEDGGATWVVPKGRYLSGTTTSWSITFPRYSTDPPFGSGVHQMNIYLALDQAMEEITSWTTNLDDQFSSTVSSAGGIVKAYYSSTVTTATRANRDEWAIYIDATDYIRGAYVRHELGHLTHWALHDRKFHKVYGCASYGYGNDTTYNHGLFSCEFGNVAMEEGMAWFFAVRSITSSNDNAWACNCAGFGSAQGTCSNTIGSALTTGWRGCFYLSDGIVWSLGDKYMSECYVPACSGWRNELANSRFLWDLIDNTSADGETENLSIAQIAGYLESMQCSSGAGDGNCNEPHMSSCYPTSDAASEGDFGWTNWQVNGNSRDAYNAWDIAEHVDGDQTAVRVVNCVQGAND